MNLKNFVILIITLGFILKIFFIFSNLVLFIYSNLALISLLLSYKYKFFIKIFNILVFPIYVLFGVSKFIYPILLLSMGYFLIFGVILFIIKFTLSLIYNNISEESIFYIILTLTSVVINFISESFNERLFVDDKSSKEFFNHLFNKKNIKLTIFTIYFILIIITTIYKNEGIDFKLYFKISDYTILQSFATYVAFDRLSKSISDNVKDYWVHFRSKWIDFSKKLRP